MKRPVFVVGCPRSGTTLLYSMLIAAGGFAIYRKETYFYDLAPRFPDLSDSRTHADFAARYLAGYLGAVPGLDVQPFLETALEHCDSTGRVLPLLMDAIADAQGMDRWVEATPAHVLCMNEIARAVPEALFVHVIRDGRDCAISHLGQGWVPTLPWDSGRKLEVAALSWEWMVAAGQRFAAAHPGTCLEVRFEDLTADPPRILERIGRFIDHDLDYQRIRANPVHALKVPNTSFRAERGSGAFAPVGRWKSHGDDRMRLCEALIGRRLEALGYEVPRTDVSRALRTRARLLRVLYLSYFETRRWLKTKTLLGRQLTSTRVWAEPPRAAEDLIRPLRAPILSSPLAMEHTEAR